MQYALKVLLTAGIVVAASELGKSKTVLGAIVASLPLTSILVLSWLYWDTKDVQRVADMSWGIFYAVVPSLLFFLALGPMLKKGMPFWAALPLALLLMSGGYWVYAWLAGRAAT